MVHSFLVLIAFLVNALSIELTHFGYERPGDPNYDPQSAAGQGAFPFDTQPGSLQNINATGVIAAALSPDVAAAYHLVPGQQFTVNTASGSFDLVYADKTADYLTGRIDLYDPSGTFQGSGMTVTSINGGAITEGSDSPALGAAPQTLSVQVVDMLLGKFKNVGQSWVSTLQNASTFLFWTLAGISLVFTGIYMAIKRAELGEILAEIVRYIMFTGFFFWLLKNGPTFALAIINSLRQLGGQAAGGGQALYPGDLISIGIQVVNNAMTHLNFLAPAASGIPVLFAVVILAVCCLIVGDVQNLALLITDPHGRGMDRGDHWQKTAYSLLVGCILHLCYKAKVERTPATFGALDQMLADSSREIKDLWQEMLSYAHVHGSNHPVVAASARDMLDRPAAEAGSVLSTAKTFLDLYRDPTVAANTSRSDFRIRDLMHYEAPVSLYIITQPNDKERLRPLVRIVVNMIVRLLADKMAFEDGRPKPTYKHKLLAMIDEFPSLGKLEILQQSLAFVAGYGIKCYLIAQDINQLKSKETGYGPDESITSNCHVQTAFPPNRLETAEHLSKLTGVTTIVKEQITRSGRGMGAQASTTMQEVQRPLLTADECLRMHGPKKDAQGMITEAGDMVVYCSGFPAIYGRQPLYFQDAVFSARAAVPPPLHSDSL